MQIFRKVIVKQVLTEQTKQKLRASFEHKLQKLEREQEQLAFEQRKMERNYKDKKQLVQQQFDKQVSMREEQMKRLKIQLEQLDKLPLGYELKTGETKELVTVEVGTPWMDSPKEIIIKNDEVLEIRGGE
ncbi:YlqD family protein [Bacillus fonticola]|uniref:YlqD family protein n=1 Tax=Bacillus fonticola TaxID=2728853 RepID=UPI00147666E7|nr:YlqD family protein [Bacillus fonticola]